MNRTNARFCLVLLWMLAAPAAHACKLCDWLCCCFCTPRATPQVEMPEMQPLVCFTVVPPDQLAPHPGWGTTPRAIANAMRRQGATAAQIRIGEAGFTQATAGGRLAVLAPFAAEGIFLSEDQFGELSARFVPPRLLIYRWHSVRDGRPVARRAGPQRHVISPEDVDADTVLDESCTGSSFLPGDPRDPPPGGGTAGGVGLAQ